MSMPSEYSRAPGSVSMVHFTDIHFGGGDSQRRAELLREWVTGRSDHFILVSGDITGRASKEEYQTAARWIRDIESSGTRVAVVPGNHDIGYWGNFLSVGRQAIGRKYHRWIRVIDRPIDPCVRGPGCVVVGLNSAHGINPTRFFNGYLNRYQRERAAEIFRATPPDHLKVMFCHHPLLRFEDNIHSAMFKAGRVREELAASGVDLFLWGHQHSFASAELFRVGGKCYAVQSPTLSDRIRDGGYPGFAVVEWFFNDKVVIRSYNVINDRSVEEAETVEYNLQGGTTSTAVE